MLLAGAWLGLLAAGGAVSVQGSSAKGEEVKALLKRIEELEQKVKALEESRNPGTNAVREQQLQELDQKVKVLEKDRELDREAADEKIKKNAGDHHCGGWVHTGLLQG